MSEVMRYSLLASPVGDLLAVSDGERLKRLVFPTSKRGQKIAADWQRDDGALLPVKTQLDAYFGRELLRFDLPLAPEGSEFQHRVWTLLAKIPYGRTRSYGDLARDLGNIGASRAVGLANGANPIPIVIPCHRVIGQDGSLTGFGGGLSIKIQLLELEDALPAESRQLRLI